MAKRTAKPPVEPPKPATFAQGVQEEAERQSSASYLVESSVILHLDQIGERIRRLVDLFENRDKAAEVAGRSTDALNRWMKGETEPTFSALARMASRKGVSLEWLASGSGEMTLSEFTPEDGYVFIPRYEVRASAGTGQIVESENLKGFLAFQADWIRSRLRRNPSNLVVLEAYGDSMRPTIKDGDIMLVDISEDRVRGPAIYVVRAGNEAIVKRVELKLDGSLLVKSDNPAYEAMTIRSDSADELRVIGKVVWTGGVV